MTVTGIVEQDYSKDSQKRLATLKPIMTVIKINDMNDINDMIKTIINGSKGPSPFFHLDPDNI